MVHETAPTLLQTHIHLIPIYLSKNLNINQVELSSSTSECSHGEQNCACEIQATTVSKHSVTSVPCLRIHNLRASKITC